MSRKSKTVVERITNYRAMCVSGTRGPRASCIIDILWILELLDAIEAAKRIWSVGAPRNISKVSHQLARPTENFDESGRVP